MSTSPLLAWPAGAQPRDPKRFSQMIEAVFAVEGVRLVAFSPAQKGKRITYQASATLGVLDTMSNRGWAALMEPKSAITISVARVLTQLARTEAQHPGAPGLVGLSLVARRLCVLAAYQLEPADHIAIALFLRGHGCRMPTDRCIIPEGHLDLRPLPATRESYLEAFLRDIETFWSLHPLRVRDENSPRRDEDEESATAAYEAIFRGHTKRAALRVIIEGEEEDTEPQVIDGNTAVTRHAGMCLAGDLLAKRATHADLAIAILRLASSYDSAAWACLRPEELTAWLVALLAIKFGIAPVNAMNLQIGARADTADSTTPGVINLPEARLFLLQGNGYYDSLYGRIPVGQILEIEFVGTLKIICGLLKSHAAGAQRLHELVPQPTLDGIFQSIALRLPHFHPAGKRTIKTQVGRLHTFFDLVGSVIAGIAPAHLALISGRTSGPSRADSNYVLAGRETLQKVLDRISTAQGALAGISMIGETPQIVAPLWIGAAAPLLTELVESIERLVSTSQHSMTPMDPLPLRAALAGCRPGAHVAVFVDPGMSGHPLCLVFADKNLGSGMHSRIVFAVWLPLLAPLVDSATGCPVSTALGFAIPNAPRKAVLTALAEAGASQLESASVSEHADNALLSGGPLCPIPSACIVQNTANRMEEMFAAGGITASLEQLTKRIVGAIA